MIVLTAAMLLVTALPVAETPAETTDYLFGRDDISYMAKDFHDGRKFTDKRLAELLAPGSRVSAILIRVKKDKGKFTEIEVWYSKAKTPKAVRVRDEPFTPEDKKGVDNTENDFQQLLKVVKLAG